MNRWAAVLILSAVTAKAECVGIRLLNRQAAPVTAVLQAQRVAERIFGDVGVEVDWKARNAACPVVEILFDQPAPLGSHGQALAYALPFAKARTRVAVFFPRVAALSSAENSGTNLGYVLAHEVGHVLEGQTRHSSAGVMKAVWDRDDLHRMAREEMKFATEDAEWIMAALASDSRRNAGQ